MTDTPTVPLTSTMPDTAARADVPVPMSGPFVFELPAWSSIAGRVVPVVLEGSIIPLVLFSVALEQIGRRGALVVAIVWSILVMVRRRLMEGRVPSIVVLGVALLMTRTAMVWGSANLTMYLLQPALGRLIVGLLFLASVPLGRPLAARLARDFVELPPPIEHLPSTYRAFEQISLLWAAVQIVNAGFALWLLQHSSFAWFMVGRLLFGWGVTIAAIVVSFVLFRRAVASHGVSIVRCARQTPMTAPATAPAPAVPIVVA